MKKLSVVILLIALVAGSTGTAAADAAGRAGAFLKMGVGARALGMGSAFTAVADDSTAAFWNPAGLVLLERHEAAFMHANLTLDRKYNFFNYAHVLKDSEGNKGGVVALSHIRFGVDGIPETRLATGRTDGAPFVGDEPATRPDGTYTPGQNVYIFSYFDNTETSTFGTYARKLSEKFYGGVNLKRINQSLFTNSADAWGLDLGFMYISNERSRFGLSIRDIGKSLKWDTPSGRSDKVPVTTSVGYAYMPREKFTLAIDVSKVQDMDAKFRAGAEMWLNKYAALRVGTQAGEMTLGASFKLDTWQFDYSYVDETLGEAHRLSAIKRF